MKQWDIVHLVMPSNIGWPVLPVVAWRRIPIYVSHHVDMHYYIYEYVKLKALADFGYMMYRIIMVLPTTWLAQVNAAPTLTFLNAHLTKIRGEPRAGFSLHRDALRAPDGIFPTQR